MTPTRFPQVMVVLAENQPEYLPLPVWRSDVETISCWKLSLLERLSLLFTGKLWLRQLNYGGSLQPQLPQVENPFK